MQLLDEVINLKAKIEEAEELSAHHKKELDKDPEDFALKLRYNSFRGFIKQLELELAEYEKQTSQAKKEVKSINGNGMNENTIFLMEQKINSEKIAVEALEKMTIATSTIKTDMDKWIIPYISVTAKMELLQEQAKDVLVQKETPTYELINLRDQLNKLMAQYNKILEDYISCISKYSLELSKNSEILEENYKKCINAILGLMADESNQTSEKLENFINGLNSITTNINQTVQYHTEFSAKVVKNSMAKEGKAKNATLDLMYTTQKFTSVCNTIAKISQEAITICIRDYIGKS